MPRKKKTNQSPFAKLLTELMAEKRLSQRDAAKIAGVSASTINGWLNGVNADNYLAVQKLAEYLGVTLSYILTGKDDSRPTGVPTLTELFTSGAKVSGIYRVEITQLLPKAEGDDSE